MVLLAVRTGDAADSSRFLCNALTSHHVQEVVESVVAVHNMRLRLQASVAACTVGAKRPRSEDEAALTAASELLSAQNVRRKVVLTAQQLLDALTALQAGAADRAVPEELSVEGAELFFAGRTLKRDARLSEYVGKNDKSQVQIQLLRSATNNGGTAPLVPPGTAPAMPPSEPAAAGEAAAGSSSVSEAAAAAAAAEAAAPAHDVGGGVSLNAYFKAMRGEPTPKAAAAAKEEEEEEEEDPAVLREDQAAQLLRSQPVQAAMRDPRLQELLRCALPAPCPLISTWAASSSPVHWEGRSEPRFPRVCHRHIDGADSRELALKRLEQALDDSDFLGFSEQVLRAIGHYTAPPPKDGVGDHSL